MDYHIYHIFVINVRTIRIVDSVTIMKSRCSTLYVIRLKVVLNIIGSVHLLINSIVHIIMMISMIQESDSFPNTIRCWSRWRNTLTKLKKIKRKTRSWWSGLMHSKLVYVLISTRPIISSNSVCIIIMSLISEELSLKISIIILLFVQIIRIVIRKTNASIVITK